jgi:hypothetical protein
MGEVRADTVRRLGVPGPSEDSRTSTVGHTNTSRDSAAARSWSRHAMGYMDGASSNGMVEEM